MPRELKKLVGITFTLLQTCGTFWALVIPDTSIMKMETWFLDCNHKPRSHHQFKVQQPSFSPDLAPCDFWLFPKSKTMLKGMRFKLRKDIMEKTTAELRSIQEEEFKRCFQKRQRRWEMCVHLQREYFERDQIIFVIFIVSCVLCPKVGYFLDRPYIPDILKRLQIRLVSKNKFYIYIIRDVQRKSKSKNLNLAIPKKLSSNSKTCKHIKIF